MEFDYVIPKVSKVPDILEDPIFAAARLAREARIKGLDPIDATIGVIVGEDPAHALVLPCVREAAIRVFSGALEDGFAYSPLLGVPEFRRAVTQLVFGDDAIVASVAATGGTAAVALNLHLAKRMGVTQVILPVPTWPVHRQLLHGSDLPYMEIIGAAQKLPTPEQLLHTIQGQQDPALFLLQLSGHNPTGQMWSKEQWQVFADGLSESPHIVLLDCAYQGLSTGVEEDIAPVEILCAARVRLMAAWSASKNHTIYNQRTGAACVVAATQDEQRTLERHYMDLARAMTSTAPVPGQQIVAMVQSEYADEWCLELETVRTEVDRKRRILLDAFPEWTDSLQGTGLFTILPLDKAAVERLREDNVFLTDDARLNLAGIPIDRFDELMQKIRKVMV